MVFHSKKLFVITLPKPIKFAFSIITPGAKQHEDPTYMLSFKIIDKYLFPSFVCIEPWVQN